MFFFIFFFIIVAEWNAMLNNEFITKKVCDHPYPPKVGVNQQQKMGGGVSVRKL